MDDYKIAVAAANFSHAFPSQMLFMLQSSLGAGQTIIQCSTAGMADSEKDRLDKILEKNSPSALIGICIKPDASTVEKYTSAGAPVILIDEEAAGASTVTTDNFSGGYIAGEYLAKSGKKKIGVVSGRMRIEGGFNAMQRVSGFIKALADNGLTMPEGGLIEVVNYSYNDGAEAMAKFLDDKTGLDGIFCAAGDMCALGMLKTARERGVNIPVNCAIVGYDDIDVARTSKPALTTIRQPIDRMAAAAFELAAGGRGSAAKPQKITFNPEIVKRASA